MQAFTFDLQRFDAVYEFTSGTRSFENSSTAYYYNGRYNNSNHDVLIIGYNINWHVDKDDNGNEYAYSVRGSDIALSGDGRILDGSGNLSNIGATGVQISGGNGSDVITNWQSDHMPNNARISGGGGNDNIDNRGAYVTIDGGDDADIIKNWQTDYGTPDNTSINGGKGNDNIDNRGTYVTIDGGDDADIIKNWQTDYGTPDNTSINGGKGNDNIDNRGTYVTIDGGDDADTITNAQIGDYSPDNTSINGGVGDDHIWSGGGNKVTLLGGVGNDNLYNGGLDAIIDGGDNDDTIENRGVGAEIYGGDGNDSISNGSDNVTIDSGLDNDYVINKGEHVSIKTVSGSDTIENYARYVTIDSGDSNDYNAQDSIVNYAANVTIEAGASDDIIENSGRASSINAGAGDDTLQLYANVPFAKVLNDALEPIKKAAQDAGLNVQDMWNSFVDVLGELGETDLSALKVDSPDPNYTGKTLKEVEDKFSQIEEEAGAFTEALDKAEGFLEKVGTSSKTITKLKKVSGHISKLAGKTNKFFNTIEILGGMTSDYAKNKIFPMLKAELLKNFERNDNGGISFVWEKPVSESTTVYGGKGDDTFYNDEFAFHVYEYHVGDGNDVIHNWNLNDTLKIIGGNYTGTVEGNDYVVRVGSGSITFKGYKLRPKQQIQTGEHLPCWIEGYNETSGTQTTPTQPNPVAPPEGVTVDAETLTAAKGFSGTIDPSEGYSPNVTHIDASKAKSVEVIGSNAVYRITLSDGNDTIYNWNDSVSVNAGGGNDLIYNFGDDTTLIGGLGNDIIFSMGDNVLFTYSNGNGNDSIVGFSETSTLSIMGGSYKTQESGSDIIVTVGEGSIILKDAVNVATVHINDETIVPKKQLPVVGTAGNDKITVDNDGATIQALGGKDSILNAHENVLIDAGDGNDSIRNESVGTGATIDGGAGNDIIKNQGSAVSIQGGAGNDSITNSGNNLLIVYTAGDGNDVITGFNATSTLSISDSEYFTQQSGKDLIVKVGTEAITLKGAASLDAVNIDGTLSEKMTITNAYTSPLTLGASVIIADASARTKAVNIVGNAEDNSIVGGKANDTISGAAGNDTLTGGAGNDVFVYSGGEDVITDYAAGDKITVEGELAYQDYATSGNDVVLSFGDEDSLTVKDGAGKAINLNSAAQIYTAEGILNSGKTSMTLKPEVTAFNASVYSALVSIDGTAATEAVNIVGNAKANKILAGANGSTFGGGTGNDTLTGGNGADVFVYTAGKDVVQGYGAGDTVSLGADASITNASMNKNGDVVINIGKNSVTIAKAAEVTLTQKGNETIFSNGVFTDSTKKTATLPATFAKEFDLDTYENADSSARSGAIKLVGNDSANSLLGGKGADTLDGGKGNDTLAGGTGKDLFVYSAGNDVITDYTAGQDSISLDSAQIADIALDGSDVVLSFGESDSLTITDGKDKKITFKTGSKTSATYIFEDNKIFNGNKKNVTLTAAATAFDASASVYSALVNIDGSAATDAVNIVGNKNANKILAGANGSTLSGAAGNDTLVGGAGNDLFVYTAGKDIVQGYSTGDKVSLGAGASVSSFSVNSASDIAFKVGSGTLTLKKVDGDDLTKGKAVTIVEGGTESTKTYFKDRVTTDNGVTLNAAFKGTFTAGDNVVTVDGTLATKALALNGNTLANVLIGGKANDILNGKAGDDTLTGGAGKDLFVYSAGSDTIVDYTAGQDSISLDAAQIADVALDGSDVVLGFGDEDSLTIKDGKDKKITFKTGKKTSATYIFDDGKIFNADKKNVTLTAATTAFDASASIYSALANIDGTAATDAINIVGNKNANKLLAGANGSTLNGGTGNDTLVGGAGNDLFVYTAGKDVVQGYARVDKISLGAAVTKTAVKSANVVLTLGKNTLTVTNAASKQLTLIDSTGTELTTLLGGLTYNNKSKASVTLPAYAEYASASTRTKAIAITGNDLDNTIAGGKGDDSLWGGSGADTFIYADGDGNDVIGGFGDDDLLKITGTFSTAYDSAAGTIKFTVGTGSITLTDFTATTFNVNGDSYQISGNKLVK